ncbi:MAG: FHA domain-containing protein [Pseudomonadota bacterium]
MARLLTNNSDACVYVREYHLIGRRRDTVDLLVDDPHVSKVHAAIEWTGAAWKLNDLSSNGTRINGQMVDKNTSHTLQINDVISICPDSSHDLRVVDLDPPSDMVICVHEAEHKEIPLENHMLLPSADEPALGLYFCEEREAWYAEIFDVGQDPSDAQELGPIGHEDTIDVAPYLYKLFLKQTEQGTYKTDFSNLSVDDVEFRFDVTQDQESTTLTLMTRQGSVYLEERIHHELLAYLASGMREQLDALENPAQQVESAPFLGWVDRDLIAAQLGIDDIHLNTLIFRARKQLSSVLTGYQGVTGLIDRRRGAVRFTAKHVSLYQAGKQIY